MPDLTIDPATTALVLIDLQRGITAGQTVPNAASDVIARAAGLAAGCRKRGVLVILVRVDPGPGGALFPRPQADQPRPPMTITPDWSELVHELGRQSDTRPGANARRRAESARAMTARWLRSGIALMATVLDTTYWKLRGL